MNPSFLAKAVSPAFWTKTIGASSIKFLVRTREEGMSTQYSLNCFEERTKKAFWPMEPLFRRGLRFLRFFDCRNVNREVHFQI